MSPRPSRGAPAGVLLAIPVALLALGGAGCDRAADPPEAEAPMQFTPPPGGAAPVIEMHAIGMIHTPYTDAAPYQPVPDAEGSFHIDVDARYAAGLEQLESFKYAYVLYYMDRVEGPPEMTIRPPWAPAGTRVGVFASRSPRRPNPIGLSIVEVHRVEGTTVHVSGLDAFDGTPVLDLKPYIALLDTRDDADAGWVDELPDGDHLRLHIAGIPHDYEAIPP